MYDQLMIDLEEFRINRDSYTAEERKELLKYFKERKRVLDEERRQPMMV